MGRPVTFWGIEDGPAEACDGMRKMLRFSTALRLTMSGLDATAR